MSAEYFSTAQFATLVVCTINGHPHRDDLVEGKGNEKHGCCPRCCAGCAVLAELIASDDLNYILRTLAPRQLNVSGYAWWDSDQECFDLSWPDAWWNLYPCLNHEVTDEPA